jgi:hypothetical protein
VPTRDVLQAELSAVADRQAHHEAAARASYTASLFCADAAARESLLLRASEEHALASRAQALVAAYVAADQELSERPSLDAMPLPELAQRALRAHTDATPTEPAPTEPAPPLDSPNATDTTPTRGTR